VTPTRSVASLRWCTRLAAGLCVAAAGWTPRLAHAADAAGAAAPASTTSVGSAVTTIVAGIVSYTRWPTDTGVIRLCTFGQGPGVVELLRVAELSTPQRLVSVRAPSDTAQALRECQVLYVGRVGASTAQDLLRQFTGLPVLLLGEGPDFCSDGGMFCLNPTASAARFNANLDAIARSGLRVNPQVLRIARGAAGGGS